MLGLSLLVGIGLAVVFSTATDLGPFGGASDKATLKVMTFNVFYGGDDYDLQTGEFCAKTNGCSATLDKVVAAIADSGADVVGLEEGEGNTEVIAKRLGWHANARTQTISRYPLIDPPGANGAYVLVELEPGKVAAVASVHLPSDPYGPYAVRDGASAAEVIALEQKTRLPMLRERLEALRPIVDDGLPVFLVGDFNSPSHLDWTEAVATGPRRGAVRHGMAGGRAGRGDGVPRLLPRGLPGCGRETRLHLDTRRAGDRPEGGARSHRLGARRRSCGDGGQRDPRRDGESRRCPRRRPVPLRPPRRGVHLLRRGCGHTGARRGARSAGSRSATTCTSSSTRPERQPRVRIVRPAPGVDRHQPGLESGRPFDFDPTSPIPATRRGRAQHGGSRRGRLRSCALGP